VSWIHCQLCGLTGAIFRRIFSLASFLVAAYCAVPSALFSEKNGNVGSAQRPFNQNLRISRGFSPPNKWPADIINLLTD
jgi:hypothetical protein